MKTKYLIATLILVSLSMTAQPVKVGAERTESYLPLLRGKRVAVMSNQTGRVGDEHLVDLLVRNGVELVGIFSPEHGFRGTADAGSMWPAPWTKRQAFPFGRYTVAEVESRLPIR